MNETNLTLRLSKEDIENIKNLAAQAGKTFDEEVKLLFSCALDIAGFDFDGIEVVSKDFEA